MLNTGEIKLFGMTAGHVVEQLISGPTRAAKVNNVDEAMQEIENTRDETTTEAESVQQHERNAEWSFRHTFSEPRMIGKELILARQENTHGDLGYFDWALFTLSSYQMNCLNGQERNRLTISDKSPGMTGMRRVFVMNGSSQPGNQRAGTLSSEAGRIILGPGEEFVDTYMLTVDKGPGKVLSDLRFASSAR